MSESDFLRDYAQEERARRSLFAFCCRTVPNFVDSNFSFYLCSVLERLRPGDRLIVTAPPGHGKSTILQAWGAWVLGRNPNGRLLTLSASEALAVRNSKLMRDLVEHDKYPWPNCKLKGDSSSVSAWETTQGNSVRTFGAGSTITGFRAEYVCVDDAQADEGTAVTRDNLERWFRNVLSTRLEPDAIGVMIQTRWSTDDIIQRLLDGDSGEYWKLLNFEAINESDDDPLHREHGVALWPGRWDVNRLQRMKVEVGSAYFQTAYQGHPMPAGGATFKEEWLRRYPGGLPVARFVSSYEGDLAYSTQAPLHIITAVDAAAKTGVSNDYSVIATLATDERDIYLLDVVRKKVAFVDLCREISQAAEKWQSSRVYIESASNGIAAEQSLRANTRLNVIPMVPDKSKQARADAVSPIFEAGRVHIPERAPWVDDFVTELLAFPGGRHDDQVDAVVLGIGALTQIVNESRENRHNRLAYRGIGR